MEYFEVGISTVMIGFLIGFLVGLTGIGGGSLMTPIMILFLGIKPTIAVGTDLVFGAITKSFGSIVHFRQKAVNLNIVFYLALGSIPSSLLGVQLNSVIKKNYGTFVDIFVMKALGITLILIAVTMVLRAVFPSILKANSKGVSPKKHSGSKKFFATLLGGITGFLVGVTSVGSGALIVPVLFLLFPGLSSREIVGTDLFHAAILVSVAGFAYFKEGDVQMPLVMSLLIGSLPGVYLGSRMSFKVPEKFLRPVLASMLMVTGLKLI